MGGVSWPPTSFLLWPAGAGRHPAGPDGQRIGPPCPMMMKLVRCFCLIQSLPAAGTTSMRSLILPGRGQGNGMITGAGITCLLEVSRLFRIGPDAYSVFLGTDGPIFDLDLYIKVLNEGNFR